MEGPPHEQGDQTENPVFAGEWSSQISLQMWLLAPRSVHSWLWLNPGERAEFWTESLVIYQWATTARGQNLEDH